MAHTIQDIKEGALVTFDNAADAQTARALLLLSGVRPEEMVSQVASNDAGEPPASTTGLNAGNWDTERLESVMLLKGKKPADFKAYMQAGNAALAKMKERASAMGVTLADPEVRYSGSESKFKATIPYTESPDGQGSTKFVNYLSMGAARVQKDDRLLIDIPVVGGINKIKNTAARLAQDPDAPPPAPVKIPASAAAPVPVPTAAPSLRLAAHTPRASHAAKETPPADTHAAEAAAPRKSWWRLGK